MPFLVVYILLCQVPIHKNTFYAELPVAVLTSDSGR